MPTSERNDARLRSWAIVALALIVIVYVLPNSILELLITRPDTNVFIRIMIAGVLLVVVLGFYLRMFFECAFLQDVHRRGVWLILFILLPIFSAFIYFFVTRSERYREHLRRVRSKAGSGG